MTGHHRVARLKITAMGCPAELLVVGGGNTSGGPEGLAHRGARLIAELEARWSRFLPDSDIGRLNTAAEVNAAASDPIPVAVHWTTRDVVLHAIEAWRLTEGRYDPTVLRSMVAHGYARSFEHIRSAAPTHNRPGRSAPGCAHIIVRSSDADSESGCTISLPSGIGLDLGGIGKGYAGDLVVTTLMDEGAQGVMVNLGGDVRVTGEPPTDTAWTIALENPTLGEGIDHQPLGSVRLVDGAVAVSSILTRRWQTQSGDVHHLIDPFTGNPTEHDTVAAMVVAGAGWWAEVLTKALIVTGAQHAMEFLARVGAGAHALTLAADGRLQSSRSFASLLNPPSVVDDLRMKVTA